MKTNIDVHVHLAAFPDGKNGCLMSPAYRRSIVVAYIKRKMNLRGRDVAQMNAQYVDKLIQDAAESQTLRQAVLLALDGVYDESGQLDEARTSCLIGNDYTAEVVAKRPDLFLFGASVNPQRRDAMDELHRVIEKGARLIKLLPNSQNIDISKPEYRPFYRLLAERKIPLLSHVGDEHTFPVFDQKFGRPERLRTALNEGTLVIAAHACGSNSFFHREFFKEYVRLMEEYANFHVDVSALSLPSSVGMFPFLKQRPEFFDRIFFGTDYPLSAFATSLFGKLRVRDILGLCRIKNTFDKQSAILKLFGIKTNSDLAARLLGAKAV